MIELCNQNECYSKGKHSINATKQNCYFDEEFKVEFFSESGSYAGVNVM